MKILVDCCDFCGEFIDKNNALENRMVELIPQEFIHPNNNDKILRKTFNINLYDLLFKGSSINCCMNCMREAVNKCLLSGSDGDLHVPKIRKSSEVMCVHGEECFDGGKYGKGCFEDELNNSMSGKPWQECYCMTEEEKEFYAKKHTNDFS
jgi:hypothetical protein